MSSEDKEPNTMHRRDMLKLMGTAAAGMGVTGLSSAEAAEPPSGACEPKDIGLLHFCYNNKVKL